MSRPEERCTHCGRCRGADKQEGKLTVKQVKAIAMAHYGHGGDGVIECWDDGMIENWIATSPGTREAFLQEMYLFNSVRTGIENTAW